MRTAIRRQRIRLAPRVIQGEHQLAPQSLAQRVLTNQRLELARHLGVPGACKVGIDTIFEAGEAQVLEPRDLRLGESLVADVRERRAAPERERLSQRLRRLLLLALSELFAPSLQAFFEAVGVERSRRQTQGISARFGDHDVRPHRSAQPRGDDLDRVLCVPRAGSLPQLVHDPVEADDRAAAHQQERQKGEHPSAR